jgi:hypothetical protein
MDEEQIGQIREISGDTVMVCELCGKPSIEVSVVVIERRSSGAPETEMRICPSCRRQLEAGELPLDPDELNDAAAEGL